MLKPFAKYVGCGNDFIIFDNRERFFPHHNHKLIRGLCHRQNGIGADGLILLEPSQKADYRMRIFNADASEAEMCGNGIRCLVKYCYGLSAAKNHFTIETMHRLHTASVDQEEICVDMGDPAHLQWNIPIATQNKQLHFHFMDTGVPHAVYFHHDIESIDLQLLGPSIRRHPAWGPHGTNVTLAQSIGHGRCKIRTFERGVEGETLGCGTGATAAAIAASYLFHQNSPMTVDMKGGTAKIGFQAHNGTFSKITMTGPATCTFEGKVEIGDGRRKIGLRVEG